MELEEIDEIVGQAEQNKDNIIEASFRYSRKLDGYKHSLNADTVPDGLEEVSPQELYRETKRFVESIEEHEETIRNLEEAGRALERISDHRLMPGQNISKESVQSRFSEVYDVYEENLEHAADVSWRGEQVPDAPDPLSLRSQNRRDTDPIEENLKLFGLLEKGY